jgi:2C-methyl-D-erythritol 2,4-cyclodiphosphate synthase
MDSLLGAAGQGDIGKTFPDNDSAYKDISSVKLLKKVRDIFE